MIIQSKFHDYYDSLAGQYTDKQIVFNREEKPIKDANSVPKELTKYLRLESIVLGDLSYESISALIFCGVIYPFFQKVQGSNTTRDFKEPYSHLSEPKKLAYMSTVAIHLPKYKGEGIPSVVALEFNKEFAPIVLIEKTRRGFTTTTNPSLVNLKFHLHPFDVYQALFQFLAPTEPPMVKIADEYKVITHGMDETSFRRDKGGPTRKRKKGIS